MLVQSTSRFNTCPNKEKKANIVPRIFKIAEQESGLYCPCIATFTKYWQGKDMDSCVLPSSFTLSFLKKISVLYLFGLCARQKLLLSTGVKSSAALTTRRGALSRARGTAHCSRTWAPPGRWSLDTTSLSATGKRCLVALSLHLLSVLV